MDFKNEMLETRAVFLYTLIYFFFCLLLLVESMTFAGVWSNLITIRMFSVWHIFATGTGILLGLVTYYKLTFSRIYTNFFSVLVLTLVVIGIAFSFLELSTYPNFIFSVFHFHPNLFLSLPVFSWLAWMLTVVFSKEKSVIQTSLLVSSSYGIVILFRLANPGFFELLGSEDKVIEWLSVVALVVACGAAARQLRHSTTISIWRKAILFTIIIACFVLVGEEISWGQRLFNIKTPESISRVNIQDETTLHNVGFIQEKLFFGYVVIGLIGSFGWLIKPFLLKSNRVVISEVAKFIPSKRYSVFFIPILIYSLMRIITGPINYKTWEEFAELLLFIGFALELFNLRFSIIFF